MDGRRHRTHRRGQGAIDSQAGDTIEIWVDNNGAQVPAPTPTTRAAVEAVTVALVIWISSPPRRRSLFTVTRAVCDRIRSTGWQHDLDTLVGMATGISIPAAFRNGDAAHGTPIRRPHARTQRGNDRGQHQ